GDSQFPKGTVAGGSSQTATIGAAVKAARDKLIPTLLKLAHDAPVGQGRQNPGVPGRSPLAGLSPEEVQPHNQGLAARNDPARFESYTAILARAGRDDVQ